jgi:hypothetical protein
MKILHLPTDVGGNAYGLSRGERSLGHNSDVLVLNSTWLRYPADRTLLTGHPVTLLERLAVKKKLITEFLHIRNRYDVFHFNSGISLMTFEKLSCPLAELPFYPKKARLVFTYNGCDARMSAFTARNNPHAPCSSPQCYGGVCKDGSLDVIRQRNIAKMTSYAHAVFALNPDLLRFLPDNARLLPYTISGWNEIERSEKVPGSGKKLVIAHAPTNRIAKGSAVIMPALEKLSSLYPGKIETLLVENMPHAEALAAYTRADLIIDQIRLGWYGALAVEGMKMGKPVLAYVREEDLCFLPPDMRRDVTEALVNATQESLFKCLCELVENPVLLRRYAEAGYEYVLRWHNPDVVARQTLAAYGN